MSTHPFRAFTNRRHSRGVSFAAVNQRRSRLRKPCAFRRRRGEQLRETSSTITELLCCGSGSNSNNRVDGIIRVATRGMGGEADAERPSDGDTAKRKEKAQEREREREGRSRESVELCLVNKARPVRIRQQMRNDVNQSMHALGSRQVIDIFSAVNSSPTLCGASRASSHKALSQRSASSTLPFR